MQNSKSHDLCSCWDGGWEHGGKVLSDSGGPLRASILLSVKWRHFKGQLFSPQRAPRGRKTPLGASGSFWTDTPQFWSFKHVEMRRAWGERIGSPLRLGRQTHVGKLGALSGLCSSQGCGDGVPGPPTSHLGVRGSPGAGTVAVTPSTRVAAEAS